MRVWTGAFVALLLPVAWTVADEEAASDADEIVITSPVLPPPVVDVSETTNSSAPAIVTNDYSRGFQKLEDLGVPNAAGAQYVEFNLRNDPSGIGHVDYDRLKYEAKCEGNAWLLSEDTNAGTAKLIMNDCSVVDVVNANQVLPKPVVGTNSTNSVTGGQSTNQPVVDKESMASGIWKKVDPAKDAVRISNYIGKMEGNAYQLNYGNVMGAVLLRATHFRQAGLTNEANGIVTRLFSVATEKNLAFRQVVNLLGDQYLNQASRKLYRTGDWQAYSNELSSLVNRYSTGWRKTPVVAALLEKVKKQLAEPGPPPLPGLSESDRQLVYSLMTATNIPTRQLMMLRYGDPWILGASSESQEPDDGESVPHEAGLATAKTLPFLDDVRKRGVQAIPMLLAMLDVDAMIAMPFQPGNTTYYSSDDDDSMDEREAMQTYRSLNRPCTVAEFAMSVLSRVVSAGENSDPSDANESPAEFRERATAWYDTIKDKSPEELTDYFLMQGQPGQKVQVLGRMIRSMTESNRTDIESRMFAIKDPGLQMNLVQQYVTSQGELAKDYLDKLEASLNESNDVTAASGMYETDDNAPADRQDYERENLKRSLTMFRSMMKTNVFESTVAGLIDGSVTMAEAQQSLAMLSSGKKVQSGGFGKLLEKAADTNLSPKVVGQLLDLLPMVTGSWYGRVGKDWKPPSLLGHEQVVRQLLGDLRPIESDEDTGGSSAESQTIGDIAAWVIETTQDPEDLGKLSRSGQMDPALLGSVLRKRVEGRLSGKRNDELEPFPSADMVTPERRDELHKALVAAQSQESVLSITSGLSMNEHLALVEMFAEEEAPTGPLLAAANRIVDVNVSPTDSVVYASVRELKGRILAPEHVHTLLDLATSQVSLGHMVVGIVIRKPGLGGVELTVKDVSKEAYLKTLKASGYFGARWLEDDAAQKDQASRLYIGADSGSGSTYAEFPVVEPETVSSTSAVPVVTGEDDDVIVESERHGSAYNDDRQSELWNSITNLCATGTVRMVECHITVNGTPTITADELKTLAEPKPGDKATPNTVRRNVRMVD